MDTFYSVYDFYLIEIFSNIIRVQTKIIHNWGRLFLKQRLTLKNVNHATVKRTEISNKKTEAEKERLIKIW